ncbi:hypothetical protein DDP54_07770 [Cellulomonas sp. WB94]|uniref:hypothetical protein n=1 Tax=Cellulomonas sp. WB94 TaxID=2173174 RepID=UPI000D56B27A|nr:hypothetical protein [Cellulomonas sp. WB94]PVU82917.1 hypothetical protein DDP54_07770 [Cellulomonas sp. WB94]
MQVTRAQVNAARGQIVTDRRLGRATPQWVLAVADAAPARSAWRDGLHLRAISAAQAAYEEAGAALVRAIRQARRAGDTWSMIAIVLERPEQEIRRRFARDADG